MRARAAVVLAIAGLTAVGCVTTRSAADRAFADGDRAFAVRDYPTAATAYERGLAANPAAPGGDGVRYRLALAYLLPESPVQDAAKAKRLLDELANGNAVTPYRDASVFLLGLQDALTTAESAADACSTELARVEADARTSEGNIKLRDEALQRQRAALAELQSQVRRLQDELQQLKNIDLRRRPSAPPR
ncbi:MAG TPA: hypothetical protein VLW17_05255 [Thermoanaerobaculaceae bacterium]|nr:hypothetical protein [Thermoanaerobaculaceae bacterium]